MKKPIQEKAWHYLVGWLAGWLAGYTLACTQLDTKPWGRKRKRRRKENSWQLFEDSVRPQYSIGTNKIQTFFNKIDSIPSLYSNA